MRTLVGTDFCSNGSDAAGRKNGESLRSLASLCQEMKIETTCAGEADRKRKRGGVVRSEKAFKDGAVASFDQSQGDDSDSSAIIPSSDAPEMSAGTTVTLRGPFHRHAVRRKHLANGSNSMELAHIRSTLRMLALSYPHISFELKDGSTGKVDCSFGSPESALSSPSLATQARALILRLCDMHPKEFSQENCIELVFGEGRHGKGSTNFRAFGAMSAVSVEEEGEAVRNKELEMVSINGRLATHNDKLADGLLGQVRQCRGESCSVHFFVHVVSESGELVVKDSVATTSVPQLDRLQTFLNAMVANALANSGQQLPSETADWGAQNGSRPGNIWMGGKRFVKSQQIGTTAAKHPLKQSGQPKPPPSPPSPFSSVFCDDSIEQPQLAETKPKAKPVDNPTESSALSFEEAFLVDDTPKAASATLNTASNDSAEYDFEDEQETEAMSSTWTRQRVKGLERSIAAITEEANAGGGGEKIKLTKQMLECAEVISQVAEKFIIIKTGCLLCAVDQHAADERVALEKLENALVNPEMNENDVVQLTNKSMRVSDILKATALNPPLRVSLSQKDTDTVKHHWSLLQKWKFRLEEEAGGEVMLHTLPTVCDRPSSVNDFSDFVKELGHFAGGELKPAFVKNVLASNACRYAIMFGDSLTHQQCVELISSLSKCDFCFICAHGRPSIVPLVDMNQEGKGKAKENGTERAEKSLKCAPKRVIRKK
ncbi:hypothetical protein ACHAXT_005810 [Thalassiosira profunda]